MTSDIQIESFLKSHLKHVTFLGVFSKDQLPNLLRDSCMVINIQNSKDKNGNELPGTHWVCCGDKGGKKWYFDSFGLPPAQEILHILGKKFVSFDQDIQSMSSTLCGQFCIAMCLFLYNRQPVKPLDQVFNSFLDQFDDSLTLEKNDSILLKKFPELSQL